MLIDLLVALPILMNIINTNTSISKTCIQPVAWQHHQLIHAACSLCPYILAAFHQMWQQLNSMVSNCKQRELNTGFCWTYAFGRYFYLNALSHVLFDQFIQSLHGNQTHDLIGTVSYCLSYIKHNANIRTVMASVWNQVHKILHIRF